MRKNLSAPYISESERTPAVLKLLAWGEQLVEIIFRHHEQELHLKDEVAVLKGETKRPKFKPIHLNKSGLLLVLERPEIPLHTNGSEQDIRDHVTTAMPGRSR